MITKQRIDPSVLTPLETVKHSIKLWTWLAEGDLRIKADWPEWKNYACMPMSNCFLCERWREDDSICEKCPYWQKYGYCDADKKLYRKWRRTGDVKYAKEFLLQLKEIEKELEAGYE